MRRLKVESDQGIRELPLPPNGDLRLGSSQDNDIVLDVEGVSRRHARLSLTGVHPRLIDVGSKNLLIVNGQRQREAVLRPGSAVRLGKALIYLEEVATSDAEIGLAIDGSSSSSSSATVGSQKRTDSVPIGPDLRSPEEALRIVRRYENATLATEARRRFLDEALAVLGARALLRFDKAESEDADGLVVEDLAGPLPPPDLWAEMALIETTGDARPEILSTGQSYLRIRSGDSGSFVAALWDAPPASTDAEPPAQWAIEFLGYLEQRLSRRKLAEPEDEELPAERTDDLNPPLDMVLGSSPAFRELLDEIRASLTSRENVLLQGETGTGKELFAHLLHRSGPTSDGPFFAVNCAAIPGELLEAELFGVARGVATGVDPRPGLFELADEGSLLLDEVADLPLALQAKLLRVLQMREIQPLGAPQPKPINVRVISTANVELAKRVTLGAFRADLFYRLDRLHFTIPPLRERPEDIPVLIQTFVRQAARKHRRRIRGLSASALRRLSTAPWPGNVRQLQSAVERAVLRCRSEVLDSTHFSSLLPAQSSPRPAVLDLQERATPEPKGLRERLDAEEKKAILEALKATGGQRSAAARRLQITRQGLFNKLRRLGLNDRSFSD